MMNAKFSKPVLSVFLTIAGTALYALTVRLFLLPSGLITGGATGLAILISHFSGLPVSIPLFFLNMLFLLWGNAELGRRFAAETLLSSLLYPGFLALMERMIIWYPTKDLLLCSLFAGLGTGFSIGLIMRAGASTGGMDIPPLVLNKRFGIPVSISIYGFDFFILLLQSFYTPAEQVLYGILLVLIYTLLLDKILLIGTSRTQLLIISRKHEEIRDLILHSFDRGVTVFYGEGGYTLTESRILLSILHNRELPKAEQLILKTDPECFMTVTRVNEVSGRGFTLHKLYL